MDKEKVCHDLAISLVNTKFEKTDLKRLDGHELVLKSYIEIYQELMNNFDDVLASVAADEAKQREYNNAILSAIKDNE